MVWPLPLSGSATAPILLSVFFLFGRCSAADFWAPPTSDSADAVGAADRAQVDSYGGVLCSAEVSWTGGGQLLPHDHKNQVHGRKEVASKWSVDSLCWGGVRSFEFFVTLVSILYLGEVLLAGLMIRN